MTNLIQRFVQDEDGATAIEYGLIAALIAVAIIGAIGAIGDNLKTGFGNVNTALTDESIGTVTTP
ncbi:Flp family type IVb pilin [Parvularcula oceani]|uniref:Flp family type IVb pilin n=1 Tax=Parvularcula oceani TaxID=1247963 RepID=UPI0004E15AAE|nr:Flp family type IVb pilin [Parvularcula oceani]